MPGEVMTDMYYPIYPEGLYQAIKRWVGRRGAEEGLYQAIKRWVGWRGAEEGLYHAIKRWVGIGQVLLL